MVRYSNIYIASLVFFVFAFVQVNAQDITLELGRSDIGINEEFTITLTVRNDRLRKYGDFPDISGFEKAGTSSSSSTNIINGQVSSTQSVTQTYLPTRQGTFKLQAFQMNVNDKPVNSRGATITVGPERSQSAGRNSPNNPFFDDPFDNFFGKRNESQEFVDVKEDAFLALTTTKDEVYTGEGFTTTLAFYVAENNEAPLQFYDLGKQLTGILKAIKPSNCWEENFNIENISGRPVTINRKNYTQYKIYQATYYPFNQDAIQFPSISLDMIKYKIAKNPSFFGRNRKEEFKKFYSQPKVVKVKDLPPHPLKEAVAVGNYRLNEKLDNRELKTGESFDYTFSVEGEGNISAIEKPMIKQNDNFDIYAPGVRQNINRRNNRVTGSKAFSYYAVPKEPGDYNLGNYFQWIYFNPEQKKYDTLASEITVHVTGKSKKNESIQASDMGSFYDRIEFSDNRLQELGTDKTLQLIANILILSVLLLSAVIVFKK